MFTDIKEELIMHILNTIMHNLAVISTKSWKILSSYNSVIREIKSLWAKSRNLIPVKIYPITVAIWSLERRVVE